MTDINNLITDNIDVWTSAIKKRNATGRGSSKKIELTGIKKLRKLILELAVRGKLVPQNPNDEPVSILLDKIAQEKTQLIADKKIKVSKAPLEITDEEKPFCIPNTWVFKRFGEVMFNRDGERKPVSADERKGIQGQYDYYGASGVIDQVNDFLFDKSLLLIGEDGANLISRTTPIAFLAHGKYWVNNHAHVLDGITTHFLEFIALHINAISLEKYITGTAQPKMNQAKMNSIVIAIPPEVEQHRIVAKVDELMALCDQLEQQTEQSLTAHQTLVEVLLNALFLSPVEGNAEVNIENSTEANTAADIANNTELNVQEQAKANVEEQFQENWQRIADHFDVLFTTEHSIEQLKQTILQLAVMGKLVPQNPGDEPASKLLEKIAEEKAQLIKDKKIKKQKPLPAITDEEKPFKIPNGWFLTRLGNIHDVSSSKRIHVKDYVNEGVPFFRSKEVGELGRGKEVSTELFIAREHFNDLKSMIGFPNPQDLMLASIGGSIGNNWIADDREFYYKDGNITKIGHHKYANTRYLKMFVDSNVFWRQVTDGVSGSAYNALTIIKIQSMVFPLPPLAEQYRIVAKVDELMALCDQLKTRLADVQTTQLHLADAVVENALS